MTSSTSVTFHANMCVICHGDINSNSSDVAEVTRGLHRLVEASKEHNDQDLCHYLQGAPSVVKVHNSCRRCYTSKRRLSQALSKSLAGNEQTTSVKALRSSGTSFNWRVHCFFCGLDCIDDATNAATPNPSIRRVATIDIKDSVLHQCEQRSDEWGFKVQGRVLSCCDLFAEEAVYHKNCHTNFFRIKVHAKPGRPAEPMKAETFDKVCDWLEVNDTELVTLQDIVEKAMAMVPDNSLVYSKDWIKRKLIDRYGDHIQFCEVLGKCNVVCWKNMAAYIINKKWHDDSACDKSEHIVVTAAKLLKTVIREAEYGMDKYPSCEAVSDSTAARDWMPRLLQIFMDNLICQETKKSALGHCIVQAVRPRSVIAPIPFALGVTVDNISASKYLMNILNTLGMSVSYDEVRRFKQSILQCGAIDQPPSYPTCFTQYVADNVDHDFCTLDGSGTLHAMGMISVSHYTEFSSSHDTVKQNKESIPRLKLLKCGDVVNSKAIPLLPCVLPDESMVQIPFKNNFNVVLPVVISKDVNLDIIWHLGWFKQPSTGLRPSWGGFNSTVVRGNPVPACEIRMLPIIDSYPNSASCVYTTLSFIIRDAQKLMIPTPVVTFDQPLWLRAVNIVNVYNLPIVCRLGAFHLQMSFLSSIGTLMDGSGLNSALECCYGTNTVKHIMSGKAVARAVRAHFLVESALYILLFKSIMEAGTCTGEIEELADFYRNLLSEGYSSETEFPKGIAAVEKALSLLKTELGQQSRTAKLWLLYLDYISSLKRLLRAERTGDWHMHLVSVRGMVNLFAATGHKNYAKCARLYIEQMSDLPDKHPELYDHFATGSHVVRRSRKLWAGISTDLAIEQAMMRSVKSSGGLTHGRGSGDSVRATWTATIHQTGSVRVAPAQFADVDYCHDIVQHPELGQSRCL